MCTSLVYQSEYAVFSRQDTRVDPVDKCPSPLPLR
jgi:hypothetical protein